MSFAPVPATAAWHHRGARSGFEVVYFGARGDGCRIEGWATAIEDGTIWAVEYAIDVDAAWATRSARICGRFAGGFSSALLQADGAGHWLVDGTPARHLDGCLDVDLEASAMTNALPVRRMGLPVAAAAAAPAAYVRAVGLAVQRLEQTYLRTTDEASCQRYDYTAPAFDFQLPADLRQVRPGARLPWDRRPVRDIDAAKDFCTRQAGFHLDHDVKPSETMRAVQMTPPGSACSVVIGEGLPLGEPGSVKGFQLVVDDLDAVRSELAGGAISEVQQMGPEGTPGSRYCFFEDPDGNMWAVQEYKRK